MKLRVLITIAVGALLLVAGNGTAGPITWYMGGALGQRHINNVYPQYYKNGDLFLSKIVFDDTNVSSGYPGHFTYNVSTWELTIGNLFVDLSPYLLNPQILINSIDGSGRDYMQFSPSFYPAPNFPEPGLIFDAQIVLNDYEGTAFDNYTNPKVLPELGVFEVAYLSISNRPIGSQYGAGGGGNITYFSTIAPGQGTELIPEPATILLFGAGLVGLTGLRIRRKKNQIA